MRSIFLLFLVSISHVVVAQNVHHPLDPLTWQEYWTVLEVLDEADRLDEDTRFSMVNLREPDKAMVRQWSAGEPIPRSAFALVRQGENSYEAVMDLEARQITSWTKLEGVQPNWLLEELFGVTGTVKQNETFVEALRKRGLENMAFVDCYALPPGTFGTPEDTDRRIAHVRCQDARGVRNAWTRQIEGLTAVVDLDEGKVLRVVDEGTVPMPTVSADYDRASLGPPVQYPGRLLSINRSALDLSSMGIK